MGQDGRREVGCRRQSFPGVVPGGIEVHGLLVSTQDGGQAGGVEGGLAAGARQAIVITAITQAGSRGHDDLPVFAAVLALAFAHGVQQAAQRLVCLLDSGLVGGAAGRAAQIGQRCGELGQHDIVAGGNHLAGGIGNTGVDLGAVRECIQVARAALGAQQAGQAGAVHGAAGLAAGQGVLDLFEQGGGAALLVQGVGSHLMHGGPGARQQRGPTRGEQRGLLRAGFQGATGPGAAQRQRRQIGQAILLDPGQQGVVAYAVHADDQGLGLARLLRRFRVGRLGGVRIVAGTATRQRERGDQAVNQLLHVCEGHFVISNHRPEKGLYGEQCSPLGMKPP